MFLGGRSFMVLPAARNLAEHGVRVCYLGSATSSVRFSRTVGLFSSRSWGQGDEELLECLVKSAENCGVKGWVLFPSSDEHVRIVAQNKTLLAQHYILTTPIWEAVKVFYDKRLTYRLACEIGVPIPRTFVPGCVEKAAQLDTDFPVVLKPAISYRFAAITNRKAYRAENRDALRHLFQSMSRVIGPSEVIVQEHLPEPSKNLFSFAGYFKLGEPLAGLSAKRARQLPRDFGWTSTFVEAVEMPELRELASQLLRAVHYTGFAEVEFMWNAERARFELLDVNTRLWAWHSLAIASGLDLPWVAFTDVLGRQSSVRAVRQGTKWVRFWKDLQAAVQSICSGDLSIRQYVTSLRGARVLMAFSLSDPMPSILEPFLLVIDRLIRMVLRRVKFQSRRPAKI